MDIVDRGHGIFPCADVYGCQLFSLAGANIREIDASFCRSVTNTTLKALPSLPALECLNLDGCQDVDDEAHVTHVA